VVSTQSTWGVSVCTDVGNSRIQKDGGDGLCKLQTTRQLVTIKISTFLDIMTLKKG